MTIMFMIIVEVSGQLQVASLGPIVWGFGVVCDVHFIF
jgi:hypothetical protein